eukprot:SAG22_NODE_5911_length_932_cov_1.211285_1_plen_51_part_10
MVGRDGRQVRLNIAGLSEREQRKLVAALQPLLPQRPAPATGQHPETEQERA